jgi:uncharacterized protein YmfQ (DUF2313 family)
MAGDIQITGKTIGKQYTVVQSLVRANAEQLLLLKEAAEILVYETNPARANYYINEWESLVGIPDDILNVEVELVDRVANVLFKITNNNEPTQKNILRFAQIFGVNVEFGDWSTNVTLPLKLPFLLLARDAQPYYIYINVKASIENNVENSALPYVLPFVLRTSITKAFEKIVRLIIPANYDVSFLYE